MSDDAKTLAEKEQHLRVPIVRRQRPAMAEHDRLPASPILIIDLDVGSVFFSNSDLWHNLWPFLNQRSEIVRFTTAYRLLSLERRDRLDDFICGHNRTGVVWDIDVESGVHLLFRVTRGRVLYHRDLVTKLGGKANSRFHAGVCDETDDDELMDAVLLELQI